MGHDFRRMTSGVAVLVLMACGGCHKAELLNPALGKSHIDRIVVLPIVDARSAPNPDHNFSDITRTWKDMVKQGLEHHDYKAVFTDDIGSVGAIRQIDLNSSDPEWVAKLGPTDAKWILVVTVTNINTEMHIGVGATTTATAYLFNKTERALWWKDTRNAAMRTGWISAGLLSTGGVTMEQGSTEGAVGSVVLSLPDNP